MRPKKLPVAKVRAALPGLEGWAARGGKIHRTFQCADFKKAIEFINRVARLAEKMDHHPDFEVHYSRVEMTLSTHDAGGITTLDLELAKKINATFLRG